jgi:hypothetical protein
MIWRMVAHVDGLGRTLIPPELRSNPEAINAPVGLVPTASVDRTDQIPGGGASIKRRSGKFAANPSVLGYVRMAVAKEKARLGRMQVGAILLGVAGTLRRIRRTRVLAWTRARDKVRRCLKVVPRRRALTASTASGFTTPCPPHPAPPYSSVQSSGLRAQRLQASKEVSLHSGVGRSLQFEQAGAGQSRSRRSPKAGPRRWGTG